MTFIFHKAKRAPKIRSRSGQEILNRLNDYLDGNCEKPVKFLVRFWQDQETSFSYKEMRQTILDGSLSEETVRLWQQDYTKLVADKMYPVWMDALKAGSRGLPIFDSLPDDFDVNTGVTGIPNVASWLSNRGAAFVTAVTNEQRKAIDALLMKRVSDKYTVDELARVLRPCIGLTEGQAKANEKYYSSIKEKLTKEHPRMKPEAIEKKAREAQMKYAAKQHRQRAYTIAHTEMAFAFNKGMDETIRQAQAEGLIGKVEKRWMTAAIGNVCPICLGLEGTRIGMDEEFNFKDKKKELFPGERLTPPAHPRCRCVVQYVEVEPPELNGYEEHDPPKYLGSLENISVNVVESTLKKHEKEIVNYDKETAIVITKIGQIFQCFGNKNTISLDTDMGNALKGASVTHNHPLDSENEYSFSDQDIRLFMENDLEVLRGIDERYIYELTRDASKIDEPKFVLDLKEDEGRHELVIQECKRLGIGYRRWKR